MNNQKPVVLVAPLDWGLGHATRCIPIIRELLEQNATVVFAAAGGGALLLQKLFPDIPMIDIPGYSIIYPSKGSMTWSIATQLPAFFASVKKEHSWLQEVIQKYKITHVISDNRFGLNSKKAKCVFITHQVKIKSTRGLQFLEPVLFSLNKKQIEKFDELWIPDEEYPNNLSGSLSDATDIQIPVKYLGILSRFKNEINNPHKIYDFIALLSGPEPQRTLLENKLKNYFIQSGKKCLLIRGLPDKEMDSSTENVRIVNTINDEDLLKVLHHDTLLFCRPGYSTLMDLAVLGHRKIMFIATPGQTEQEYLANRLSSKYNYTTLSQDKEVDLSVFKNGDKIEIVSDASKLRNAIRNYLYQ